VAADLRLVRLEQSEAAEVLDELVDYFGRRSDAELPFECVGNRLDRGEAVELSSDEVLDFAEAKEPARSRILYDKDRAFIGWLRAYPQIAAKGRWREQLGCLLLRLRSCDSYPLTSGEATHGSWPLRT
jgi:hypothetical protein